MAPKTRQKKTRTSSEAQEADAAVVAATAPLAGRTRGRAGSSTGTSTTTRSLSPPRRGAAAAAAAKERNPRSSSTSRPTRSVSASASTSKKLKGTPKGKEDNEDNDTDIGTVLGAENFEAAAVPSPSSAKTNKETKKNKANKSSSSKSKKTAATAAAGDSPKRDSSSTKKKTKETPPPSSAAPQITKPAPTVDVTVHRIRHCDYHPKPILCLAATNNHHNDSSNDEPGSSSSSSSWLAVSRESGSIALKAVAPKLRTLACIAGRTDAPLTALCWLDYCDHHPYNNSANTKQKILVGASGNDLYVVDFWRTNQLVAQTPCGGGGVFCLERVVSVSSSSSSQNWVAAGCQDGSIRIFALLVASGQGHYQLQLVATIPTTGAAILSLACCGGGGSNQLQPPQKISSQHQKGSDSMVGAVLFAGVADGTIRRYDCTFAAGGRSQNNNNTSAAAVAATTSSAQSSSFYASSGVLWKSTLRMTVESYGRSTPTRVWALKATQDGTVVSGDSLGHVQFWDGHTGTLTATFDQNDNKADVLVLDVTADECKVFASGVDSRVICIERSMATTASAADAAGTMRSAVHDSSGGSSTSKWVMTHAQRPHTHDVKAAAIVQKVKPGGRVIEILCTGGLDTKLCTYSVGDFGARRPRALYPWPSLKRPIHVARHARLLTMLREDRIDLYELAPKVKDPKQMTAPVLVPEENTLVGTIQVKGLSNLVCSAISDNGQFLALSDSYSLLLFHLKMSEAAGSGARQMVPSKIPVALPDTATSIGALRFLNKRNLLVVATTDGRVHVISWSSPGTKDDDEPSDAMDVSDDGGCFEAAIEQTLDVPKRKANVDDNDDEGQSSKPSSLLPVHSVIASDCGNWFATQRSSSSQLDGTIDVYKRTGDGPGVDGTGASYQFWWALPSLGSAISATAFLAHGGDAPRLAVACVDYATYVFDVKNRCLGEWSEKAGYPVSGKLPVELASRNDFPVRIGINPGSPSVVLVGSFGAIVALNTEVEFPQECRIFPETHVRGKKRKRSLSQSEKQAGEKSDDGVVDAANQTTCTMCLRYNSMLYMDFVSDNEMVIVEQPWLNVVATFPDALQRRVYGT